MQPDRPGDPATKYAVDYEFGARFDLPQNSSECSAEIEGVEHCPNGLALANMA
jgi:hypothetical protein